MKYFSVTIWYDGFINKVLNGNIKLDIFKKYKLPDDRKELEDNDRKAINSGKCSVGDIFLNEAIDIVEQAFKRNNLIYANQYVWPAEGMCVSCELKVGKRYEHYGWRSGDFHIWTKAEDLNSFDAVRLTLEIDGIRLEISELSDEELNENPHKCNGKNNEMFKTVKEYIDEE